MFGHRLALAAHWHSELAPLERKTCLFFCHAVTYQSSMLTWQSGLSWWMIGCHHVTSASWRLPLYLCRPLQPAVKIESRKPRFLTPRDKVLISLNHNLLLIEKSMLSCFFILFFILFFSTLVLLDLWDQGVQMNIIHIIVKWIMIFTYLKTYILTVINCYFFNLRHVYLFIHIYI